MQHMVKDVAEFHKVFGASTSDVPAFPSDERIALRRSLITRHEFWRGVRAWDMVETARGIVDLLHELVSLGLELGLHMTIVSGYGPSAKSPSFPDEDTLAVCKRKYVQATMDFWQAVAKRDLDETELTLSALINRTIFTAREFYIPLNQCWFEAHSLKMRVPDIEGIMRAAGWTPMREQGPAKSYDHR